MSRNLQEIQTGLRRNEAVITKDSKIIDVIQKFPEAAAVFERFGMGCLGCMGMINETIENGAKMHRISLENLLKELNKISN